MGGDRILGGGGEIRVVGISAPFSGLLHKGLSNPWQPVM